MEKEADVSPGSGSIESVAQVEVDASKLETTSSRDPECEDETCSKKSDPVDSLLEDEVVVNLLDAILKSAHIVVDFETLFFEEETRLTPSKLEGIGKEKVRRLDEYGIHSVESLACIDETNGKRASQITGNVRQDGAIRTLTGWKRKAITYIERTSEADVYVAVVCTNTTRKRKVA